MTEAPPSIASPVRGLGAARIVAGGWLVATAATTLGQRTFLMPMAARLFTGDAGTTDAPLRSLITLAAAPILAAIGFVLMVVGFRWMRRIPVPSAGPVAIPHDEVVALLVRREAPAFGAGPALPYWPLRRWLSDKLDDLTWWRRDLMGRGVRAFVRACGFTVVLAILYIALPFVSPDDLLGPFPTAFVAVLLIATASWAVLGLMLIPSNGPRIESFEFPMPRPNAGSREIPPDTVIESRPHRLGSEPAALGVTLGIVGVAVQCVIGSWWQLSLISYPLTTSIIRYAGSLAGGIFFLVLGGRMVSAAAEMLRLFRYESTIVYIGAGEGQSPVAYGASVRTESRGLEGPRHIVVAVASVNAREDAQALLVSGMS